MEWKLISSKIVFDNYTKIEERVYEMPDGRIKNFYIKVVRPSICILAITDDNKVIVAKQFRPGPNKILNELPGGYIDEGESPEVAVARELREETGYEGDIQFVANSFFESYNSATKSFFVATNCKKIDDQQLEESEFIELKLIDLPEFIKIVRSGQLTDVDGAMLGLDKLGLLK